MPVRYRLDVSLPVFRELTLRLSEGQTHDDVLREILRLDSIVEVEAPDPLAHFAETASAIANAWGKSDGGFRSRGLWLPNGSKLRARYRQKLYHAEIKEGNWLSADGKSHSSPSAAASAITRTTVNGLRFWEAQRPGEQGWRRLEQLVTP